MYDGRDSFTYSPIKRFYEWLKNLHSTGIRDNIRPCV